VNLITDPELKTVKILTHGHGADVVVDAVGSPELMSNALLALAERGRFSYISAPKKGSTEFTFDMKELYREEKMIIGCNSALSSLQETASELNGMTTHFESGGLQVASEKDLELIGIENAVEAYESLKNGERKKFVIVF
jgi:NADPH2:quinone reductase